MVDRRRILSTLCNQMKKGCCDQVGILEVDVPHACMEHREASKKMFEAKTLRATSQKKKRWMRVQVVVMFSSPH